MPFIHVRTNVKIDSEKEKIIKSELGNKISLLNKSEAWLMIEIEDERRLWFQGENTPCAMVNVELLGAASRADYERMTAEVTDMLHQELGIPKNRVYTNYSEFSTWGYNGGHF